ncbi:MAG: MaoC family dehydratase [Dehalococcoidia bacterium]
MADSKRVAFSLLETGHEFPAASYVLDPQLIESYLKATGETNPLFEEEKLVPPTAVAAYALAALAEGMEVPPGTIHTSQEVESVGPVYVNDTITSCARVSSRKSRRDMEIMTVDIDVTNQKGELVLKGKTTFLSSSQIKI